MFFRNQVGLCLIKRPSQGYREQTYFTDSYTAKPPGIVLGFTKLRPLETRRSWVEDQLDKDEVYANDQIFKFWYQWIYLKTIHPKGYSNLVASLKCQ